jgi:hypothetical protein
MSCVGISETSIAMFATPCFLACYGCPFVSCTLGFWFLSSGMPPYPATSHAKNVTCVRLAFLIISMYFSSAARSLKASFFTESSLAAESMVAADANFHLLDAHLRIFGDFALQPFHSDQ